MSLELIKFNNVKTKYYVNEDILLEYVLSAEIHPSYCDWIGLYPRGWKDLLHYVTFEWIVSRPCEVALQRNILFDCRYHSQVVCPDKEYQFLYINKESEVMGSSQYFKFLPVDTLTNKKNAYRISSEKAVTSNFTSHSSSPSVKSSAEQIYKLQDHIRDLENDLEMSKTAQKQLKLAVIRSKKEKQAYQKFVSELLLALSQKGIARVIDGEGKQILVKRVLNNKTWTEVIEEHPPQDTVKAPYGELLLKPAVDCQEQMIHELCVQLDSTSKMDLVISDQNSKEEQYEELSKSTEPLKQPTH